MGAEGSDRLKPVALIVEDDESNRGLLATLLRQDGWEVRTAENGVGGMAAYWKMLREHAPPALIVMDLMMPEMDGYTTAERIRGVERERGLRRARIVGYTAYSEYNLSREALKRADFDAVAEKGIDLDELRALCAEARHGRA